MDLLSYDPGSYRAFAAQLEAQAESIEAQLPPVERSFQKASFNGHFANEVKQRLRRNSLKAQAAANQLRGAAQVARRCAGDLERAQSAERARRAAEAERLRRLALEEGT